MKMAFAMKNARNIFLIKNKKLEVKMSGKNNIEEHFCGDCPMCATMLFGEEIEFDKWDNNKLCDQCKSELPWMNDD